MEEGFVDGQVGTDKDWCPITKNDHFGCNLLADEFDLDRFGHAKFLFLFEDFHR